MAEPFLRTPEFPVPRPALIASDVDGTLLDDTENITARTRAAVHAAVDSGTRFVLATGRPPRWIAHAIQRVGDEEHRSPRPRQFGGGADRR